MALKGKVNKTIAAASAAVFCLSLLLVFGVGAKETVNEFWVLSKEIFLPSQTRLLDTIKNDLSLLDDTGTSVYTINPATLQLWLVKRFRSFTNRQEYSLDREKIMAALANLPKSLTQPAIDARISISESGQLVEQKPSQKGRTVNIEASITAIANALNVGNNSVGLKFIDIEPAISADKIKKLGIEALLGTGQTNFLGSPKNRMENIKVGSAMLNGKILASGDEFSFNDSIGEVTASAGFKPELVIKNKGLIAEYGGGLCQVSTTLFRAVMASGLQITERHPHSLPVRYYNPQGYDATVYPGISDFKFKNDTVSPVLIQAKLEGANLAFEIFGSYDGRKTVIDGPHIYESQPSGAMKTWLKRIVTFSDGTEKKDMYYSNYQSPSLFPTSRNPLE